ncbi:MAG: alpha/beta hydrolase [Solirubrobacteraceae bacterium]|nr:alpha/beta hydrolase [Solirubrobacteraceae bacterium]
MVSAIGVELEVEERGSGPAVLLVHGIASDHLALEPLAEELAGHGARVVSYSRRGYASSGAPEPYVGTTVQEQAEDAAALAAAVGVRNAVVVGDGFGALVVLDLLVRHPGIARAAVLADPPLLAFVEGGALALATWHEELREAVAAGGPAAAVELWLAGRAAPADLARARAAHRAFFADWAGLASLPLTRGTLRAIDIPVVVVTGSDSPPPVVAAADVLAGLVSDAERTTDGDLGAAAQSLLRRGGEPQMTSK